MFQLFEKRSPVPRDPVPAPAGYRCARSSAIALLAAMTGIGCATTSPTPPPAAGGPPLEDIVIYHRAESDRADQLSLEVSRLRADLRRAEEALVEVESGLRGDHTHAKAVSAIAEARILVERSARAAPWRVVDTRDAASKLVDADHQVQQNNPGAALFFVYRARRIAELSLLEAELVSGQSDTYFVDGNRVNLRSGPTTNDRVLQVLTRQTPVFVERRNDQWALVRVISGSAGWIHESLLRR